MKPILEVHNVSKQFTIQHLAGGYLSLRERMSQMLRFERSNKENFLALNDVSFNVNPGESIGIIGRNGAGKSTLLKVLSKITPPSKGKIVVRGRIASLLEVGTGFHPELTGRENIFFNGSLLGMKRAEIGLKFDEIVDFSGTEKFLDTPLKHYSSGMQLRLAFSVAAFLEPEILVIDEVLAVGDAEFQKKCLDKMEDVSRTGRTILFVSHNMTAISNFCHQGILLSQGSVRTHGPINDVIRSYQNNLDFKIDNNWKRSTQPKGNLYFTDIKTQLVGEHPAYKLVIEATLSSSGPHEKAFVAFDFTNSMGNLFMQALPKVEPFLTYSPNGTTLRVEVELPPLIPDTYYVSAWTGSHFTSTFDQVDDVVQFEIEKSPTPGRTFPHIHSRGVIVPNSKVKIV